MTSGLTRLVVGFALIGGVGIPVLFIAFWALTRVVLAGNADALYHASAWIEAFRVMLWPSSLLVVVRTAGDTAGEIRDLLIAVSTNVGVYAMLGGATAVARRNLIAEIVLVIVVVVLLYAINAFWSNHPASFVIAAAVIVVVFIALFRRYGGTTNTSPAA